MNFQDSRGAKKNVIQTDVHECSLHDFLSLRLRLSERSLEKIQQCCTPVELNAGSLLFASGARANRGVFLRTGIVRVWSPGHDGKNNEATRQFFRAGSVVSPYSEFMKQAVVAANFSAVSAVSGWIVDLEKLRELAAHDAELQSVFILIANDYIESLQRRVDVASRMDASSRLNWFYENHRELIGVAPQSVLASYVGLTRETVNRLSSKRNMQKLQSENTAKA